MKQDKPSNSCNLIISQFKNYIEKKPIKKSNDQIDCNDQQISETSNDTCILEENQKTSYSTNQTNKSNNNYSSSNNLDSCLMKRIKNYIVKNVAKDEANSTSYNNQQIVELPNNDCQKSSYHEQTNKLADSSLAPNDRSSCLIKQIKNYVVRESNKKSSNNQIDYNNEQFYEPINNYVAYEKDKQTVYPINQINKPTDNFLEPSDSNSCLVKQKNPETQIIENQYELNEETIEELNGPKKSLFNYLWNSFKKNKGYWILFSLHLFLNLIILMIPAIVFSISNVSSLADNKNFDIIYNDSLFIQTYQGVFLSSIVINSLFVLFYGIFLGATLFGNSKDEGLELLLVSKPITRRDIATVRITFSLLISIVYALIVLIWLSLTYSISLIGFDVVIHQTNTIIDKHNSHLPTSEPIPNIDLGKYWFLTKFSLCFQVNFGVVLGGSFAATFLGILFACFLSGLIATHINRTATISVLFTITVTFMCATIVASCTQTMLISPIKESSKNNRDPKICKKIEKKLNDKFAEWFVSKKGILEINNPIIPNEKISIQTSEVIDKVKIANSEGTFFEYKICKNYLDNKNKYNNSISVWLIPQSSVFKCEDNPDSKFFESNALEIFKKNYPEIYSTHEQDIKKGIQDWLSEINKPEIYPCVLNGNLYKINVKSRIYKMFYEDNSNEIEKIWNLNFNDLPLISIIDYLLPTSSFSYMQGLGQTMINLNHATKMFYVPLNYLNKYSLAEKINKDMTELEREQNPIIYSLISKPKIDAVMNVYNNFIDEYENAYTEKDKNQAIIKAGNLGYQTYYSIPSFDSYSPVWGQIILNLFTISLMSYFLWFIYQRRDFS